MADPFVVIGGDAAGLSAASKLKREAPEREVIVFEKGRWVSYSHCGMPYFVKGEVPSLSDLLTLLPEEIEDRGIDLRREHEVRDVSPDEQTVTVRGPDGEFERRYGDLLVATGAHPVTEPIAGSSLDGAFTMHDLDSAAAVRAFLEDPETASVESVGGERFVDEQMVERYGAMDPPESVAIVGGGYVGVEMAEAFSAHDLTVHLFQRASHPLSPFGEAVGKRVESHLEANGVHLHMGCEVETLRGDERVEGVAFGGAVVPVELALVGIGVVPNTDCVADAGVELGASGAIATDECGRTNRAGIYAAGDCAEMDNAITGAPAWVPLGLTANRAGRAIGRTVAGEPTPVGDVAGTAVLKAFDLEVGRTGLLDEADARDAGFDPVTETITADSRSGYYPGAADTTVTLVADRETGRVLGGSVVGRDRAAIRIDIVAMAVQSGLTAAELERRDLAYAPPFSPVWDPVLVAAKVLDGRLGATGE